MDEIFFYKTLLQDFCGLFAKYLVLKVDIMKLKCLFFQMANHSTFTMTIGY